MLPQISGEFGVWAEPELRFTPSGAAVCTLKLIAKDRKKDGQQWVDGDPCFLDAVLWRQQAENAAESVTKGSTVIITGRLEMRQWEDKEGNKRNSYQIAVNDFGLSLRWNPAQQTSKDRPQATPQAHAEPTWLDTDPPF